MFYYVLGLISCVEKLDIISKICVEISDFDYILQSGNILISDQQNIGQNSGLKKFFGEINPVNSIQMENLNRQALCPFFVPRPLCKPRGVPH